MAAATGSAICHSRASRAPISPWSVANSSRSRSTMVGPVAASRSISSKKRASLVSSSTIRPMSWRMPHRKASSPLMAKIRSAIILPQMPEAALCSHSRTGEKPAEPARWQSMPWTASVMAMLRRFFVPSRATAREMESTLRFRPNQALFTTVSSLATRAGSRRMTASKSCRVDSWSLTSWVSRATMCGRVLISRNRSIRTAAGAAGMGRPAGQAGISFLVTASALTRSSSSASTGLMCSRTSPATRMKSRSSPG